MHYGQMLKDRNQLANTPDTANWLSVNVCLGGNGNEIAQCDKLLATLTQYYNRSTRVTQYCGNTNEQPDLFRMGTKYQQRPMRSQ